MKKRAIIIPAACVTALAGAAAYLYFFGLPGGGSSSDKVYVEPVSTVMSQGGSYADVFMGVTEAPDTTKVKASSDRKVEEVLVGVGDFVNEGDVLFLYQESGNADTIVQLKLDIESYDLDIKSYNKQIDDYNKTLEGCNKQLGYLYYNVNGQVDPDNHRMQLEEWYEEIESINNNMEEINTNIEQVRTSIAQKENDKKAALAKIEAEEKKMGDREVYAPVSGTIRTINDPESPDYDYNDASFITIQHVGALRVKGTINEQNIWSISESMPVIIRSRIDSDMTWTGYISSIDTEKPASSESSDYGFYVGGGSEGGSSKYNFYVTLDEADRLLLGQHVYIELGDSVKEEPKTGTWLYDYYICYDENGNPYVWAADRRMHLEKRAVTLGEYDDMQMSYEILSGLADDDLICYPMDYLYEGVTCVTTYEEVDYSSPMYTQDMDMPSEEGYDDGTYTEDIFSEDMPVDDMYLNETPIDGSFTMDALPVEEVPVEEIPEDETYVEYEDIQ